MDDLLRFLGKSERLAFLKDCVPAANRHVRRSAGTAVGSWTQGAVKEWSDLRKELVSLVFDPLAERGRAAGLLDERDAWLRGPSEAQFRTWVSEIAGQLDLDPPRVALALVAEISAGLGDVKAAGCETPRPAPPALGEVGEERAARGSEPAPDHDGDRGDDRPGGAPFDGWLAEVGKQAPEWAGWEQAMLFADELRELAACKIEERSSASRKLEEVLLALTGQTAELEYLEKTSWLSWAEPPLSIVVSWSLVERVERLSSLVERHAELRMQPPRRKSEEAAHWRQLEALFEEIEAVSAAIEAVHASVESGKPRRPALRPACTDHPAAPPIATPVEPEKESLVQPELSLAPCAPAECPCDELDHGAAEKVSAPEPTAKSEAPALLETTPPTAGARSEAPLSPDVESPGEAAAPEASALIAEAPSPAGAPPEALQGPSLEAAPHEGAAPGPPVVAEKIVNAELPAEASALTGDLALAALPPPDEHHGAVALPSPEAPPSVAVEWPNVLATLESFAEAFSLGPDNQAVRAPWHNADFAARLAAKFDAELARRPLRFLHLWILASPGADAGDALPSSRDVEELAVWWTGAGVPRSHEATRAASIHDAYENAAIGPTARWRVTVLLEALSASATSVLEPAFIEEVVHQLKLGDHGFEVALIELLGLRTRVPNPVEWLRPLLKPVLTVPLSTSEQRLSIHRRELFEYFRSVMQAGGGKIQQTHCREAWREFVDRVLPGLKPLFPVEHGGDASWETDQKKIFVDGVEGLHTQVADRCGARLKDRVRMDRIAERLAVHARTVNVAMTEVEGARQRSAGRFGDISVRAEVFRNLSEGPTPPGPVGGLREILVRALYPAAVLDDAQDPLEITERDLREYPDLLEHLPPVGGTAESPEFGCANDLLDLRATAAVLLGPKEDGSSTEPLPDLLRACGRRHLLGKIVALCPEEDRLRIHAEQDAVLEHTRRRLAEVQTVRLRLADAASPLSEALTVVQHRAFQVLDQQPARMRLFVAWLDAVLHFGRQQLDAAGRVILDGAAQQGTKVLEQVTQLVDEQRFAEALTVLYGSEAPEGRSVRHTQSRRAAGSTFKEPFRRLAEPDVASRVPRWLAGASDLQQERAIRTEFAKLVLEDLYPKEKDQTCISVRCDDVRQHLDERQLNPCYVPQLQRFGHISIPRIVVRVSDPLFPVRAADAAGQCPNDLVILLAPRITAARRDAVLYELRRRGATAVVVDDLDLCRLLNPGGIQPDAMLSLLEIALEQQRWTGVSPFGVVEGQHVQLEMYVGRRDEARDLAHTSRYSRLFSGRKLGKSALLRYVEQRYDGRPLPSGKSLRVLYVSAVGIDTDVALVDQIVGCLAGRCGPDPEHDPRKGEEPAARLERVLTWHIQQHKEQSLLIVLDEADAFVEAELDRYQRRPHESCLSWTMSRRIESTRDSQGLPRIRFVFTGYRVTNTREGVWFNWSEVLQLVPLPVDEAAELVAAPLARLGIDATEQSAVIAHRCGYQPAVLLRFGERLLGRLEQHHPSATREQRPTVVTADDVAATFEDDAIQDEICRVTRNNFRDNDIGAVLFGALLGLYLAMGPAAVLDAAEDKLIDRLRMLAADGQSIDRHQDHEGGEFGWMAQEGGNLHEQIKGKLRDLVARQLLVERRLPGDRVGYALKFPHHLTVLAPLAREERIREAIRRIQAGAGAVVHQGARGLLARGDFNVVRDLVTIRPDPTLLIAPVVGHLWSLPPHELLRLLHRGLFDPLSLDRARVFDPAVVVSTLPTILDDTSSLAFHGVHDSDVDALLARRPPTSPMPLLVGGVDLLRHAIRAARRHDGSRIHLQAIGFGRLLRGHLAWWFERARGFNFTQPDAIDRIAATTSGVPLLVSVLDRNLKRHDPDGGGLEVTAEMLAEALDDLNRHLDRVALLLTTGGPETLLLARELELLRMLAFAARSSRAGTTSWEDISEHLWPEYAKTLPAGTKLEGAFPIRAEELVEDQVALELLEQVGLVPSRPEVAQGLVLERLGPVRPDDALVRLAERLP